MNWNKKRVFVPSLHFFSRKIAEAPWHVRSSQNQPEYEAEHNWNKHSESERNESNFLWIINEKIISLHWNRWESVWLLCRMVEFQLNVILENIMRQSNRTIPFNKRAAKYVFVSHNKLPIRNDGAKCNRHYRTHKWTDEHGGDDVAR